MYITLKKTAGRAWWRAQEIYRELFIENSDVKKIERALQRLHDVAHARPLREDGRHILIFNLRPWYT
ncbi:MAG: hypothetical protein KA248_01265, partial [Kiritimatiellae bacterium]|nr:hypothetical protein [Kiritimatiellia bacterium]